MNGPARTVLVIAIALALCLSYCLFNTSHLSRSIGYDEVYYFFWVDNWSNGEVFYAHHLLFGPTSVVFQRGFTALTGITSTAFIQRFKNILVVSIGLAVFFLMFYAHSRRILLSLAVAILIGISGSLWHDARQNETSAIPAVLIVLTMFSLVFYRKCRYPILFIVIFSVFNSLAILLHQALLFSVPPAALAVFFGPRKGPSFSWLRAFGRSGLYILLMAAMVGGAYFYVGFVKLRLQLVDNAQGMQNYMSVNIKGNFFRYFYLIQAHGMWGEVKKDTVRQGITGYLSSFVAGARPDRIDPGDPLGEESFASTATLAVIGGVLLSCLLFFLPVFRRYGALYPALLLWFLVGSAFIFWWEPLQTEHWIYITILTWVLAFMIVVAVLERLKRPLPRSAAYAAACTVLCSFGLVVYYQNFTNTVLTHEKLSLSTSAKIFAWREEYKMEEIYREPRTGEGAVPAGGR
jgi:hypothetical protein